MVTVRFARMWNGFIPTKNPLLSLLAYCLESDVRVVQNPRAAVDIEFASVYPPRRTQYANMAKAAWAKTAGATSDPRGNFIDPPKSPNAKLGIWYTPENVRPPASGWDVTLSFETTGWTSRNVYLPFWQLGTDLFGGQHVGFLGRTITIQELTRQRVSDTSTRKGFCCTFIRNPDPVRMRAIKALSSLGQVDVFGLAGGQQVESKLNVARDYKFMLCFENDLYPGYVTEKLFDAWATGAIPLWWGLENESSLNPSALLNLADFNTIDEFVTEIAKLNADGDALNFASSQALLLEEPSASGVARVLKQALDNSQQS